MTNATFGRGRAKASGARPPSWWFRRLAASLASAALAWATLAGCAKLPAGKSAVDAVDIEAGEGVDGGDVADKIATAPTPRFLGVFKGVVYDYEVYDERVLARDLERIERYYRSRGYYDAKVRAARVEPTGERSVRVAIEVDEGRPSVVRSVHVEGLEALDPKAAASVRATVRTELKEGQVFDEDAFDRAGSLLEWSLKDHSYALAKVEKDAAVDVAARQVDVTFQTAPGPSVRVTGVKFEGLGELPEGPLRTIFNVRPGKVYSETLVDDGRQALIETGLFSDVDVRPETDEAPAGARTVDMPLVVKVSRAPLRTLRLGGGAELDSLRAEVHGLVRWEHRNFLGGLRNFRVDLQPELVLYPTRLGALVAPTDFLPGERARFELRRPGFPEARTTARARVEVNTYPVILQADPAPDQQEFTGVLGYLELRGSVGFDRVFSKRWWASVSQNAQFARPFAYRGQIADELTDIIISYPELAVRYDGRDDPLRTKRGFYAMNTLQAAGLGGDARDVRFQPEARAYVPVGRGRKFVVAARGMTGFLLPFNYGKNVPRDPGTGALEPGALDAQLLFFRGFFSGGPNSNRGYPLRGVGPHASIPFFSPETSTTQIANGCNRGTGQLGEDDAFDRRCLVPFGGQSLWELSLEGRWYVKDPFSVVAFCDASDVSVERLSLRFDRPHLSCGAGGRLDTPVGPVRLDVAYRIPGLQQLGSADRRDVVEPPTFLGAPIALQVGIGESF